MSAWPVAVDDSVLPGIKKHTVIAFHSSPGFASQRTKYFQPFVPGECYFTTTDEVPQRLVQDIFMEDHFNLVHHEKLFRAYTVRRMSLHLYHASWQRDKTRCDLQRGGSSW